MKVWRTAAEVLDTIKSIDYITNVVIYIKLTIRVRYG